MSAVRYTLAVEAGATYARDFIYTDPNGDPIDLSDYTAKAQIRETPSSEPALVDVAPAIDGPAGKVSLVLTAVQTRAAVRGEVWALELRHTSGEPVIRLAGGPVEISPEVVRD